MSTPTAPASPIPKFQIDRSLDLPTVPLIISHILQILDDDMATAQTMEEIILHDQALSARLLRLANSALYSFRCEVKTISHAITLLGLNLVKSLAIGTSIFDSFARGSRSEACHINRLWMHSYGVGLVSQEIWKTRATRKESEFAFLCGLLHDLGKAVFFKKAPQHYSHIFTQKRTEGDPDIATAEQEYYGISHAPLGGLLAEHWGFPPGLCTVIGKHHAAGYQDNPIVAAVSAADTIVRLCGIGSDGDQLPNPDLDGVRKLLEMDAGEYEHLSSFAACKRKDIEDFFQLAA